MDKILTEQNFSNSDRANPNSAAKIGKLLGADAIIVGSITQFGNDTKKTGIGGAGGGLGGFGLGGFKHSNTKAIVALDARIVDIDTAEILLSPKEKANRSARAPRSLEAEVAGMASAPEVSISGAATFRTQSLAKP